MIKLTFKVNGLKAMGDLPPQGRAGVLNAAVGRFFGVFCSIFSFPLLKNHPFRRFVQNVQKSAKIILRSNTLDFVWVRVGVRKILKLFFKNVLDVSWRL